MVSDHKASMLVIDGLLALGSLAASELETKTFIHGLQVFVELVGCTTLVLTGATTGAESYALRTMVDGLLELRLEAVKQGESGVYFGFFEAPAALCRRAEGIGLDLSGHIESGLLDIMWQSAIDPIADALAERVLAAVRERGMRRLFIDGLGGFKGSLVSLLSSRSSSRP